MRKVESSKFAINVLTRLKVLLNIAKIDEKTIEPALSSGFRDFEDAVQNYTAIEADAGYLITGNTKDYKGSSIVACTAKEYLSIRSSGAEQKF